MNVKREVGRRFAIWLLIALVTVGGITIIARPLDHMPRAELFSVLSQLLLVGSLLALSWSYFTVRMGNEKIARGVAAFWLAAPCFFPNYFWNPLERVFGGIVNPTVSALLVILLMTVLLNLGLYFIDRGARARRGRSPS
jgi:hypothetical protein